MSRYFIPIPNTLKELGRMHRDLSKKHHPDLVGGNSAVMQNINSERDELKSKIEEKNSKKYGHRAESYKKVTLSVVTAKIREFVKIKFPDCKFSCSYKKHIIYVSLMEASQKVYTTSGTDRGYIKNVDYYLRDDSSQDHKIFLTEYGKVIIVAVKNYIEELRSEFTGQRFYLNFDIGAQRGKSHKPFKVVKNGK